MSDARRRLLAIIGYTAVAVFVVSPLSMGPVSWLSDHFNLWTGPTIVSGPQFTFYAPLFWIAGNCRPFGEALIWYVHLWADIAG
jgi:hypothetical protein